MVRTPPFHGGNMGSNPVGVTKNTRYTSVYRVFFMVSKRRERAEGAVRGDEVTKGAKRPPSRRGGENDIFVRKVWSIYCDAPTARFPGLHFVPLEMTYKGYSAFYKWFVLQQSPLFLQSFRLNFFNHVMLSNVETSSGATATRIIIFYAPSAGFPGLRSKWHRFNSDFN